MVKRIYKYPIVIAARQRVEMPIDAEIIHAGIDVSGLPCLWAVVDCDMPIFDREVLVFGTGHDIADVANLRHIGTFNQGGQYTWHVFEAQS